MRGEEDDQTAKRQRQRHAQFAFAFCCSHLKAWGKLTESRWHFVGFLSALLRPCLSKFNPDGNARQEFIVSNGFAVAKFDYS